MIGWHHQHNGHEFEQTPGDNEGQGSLVCCSPLGHKESDTTEQLNNMCGPNTDDQTSQAWLWVGFPGFLLMGRIPKKD